MSEKHPKGGFSIGLPGAKKPFSLSEALSSYWNPYSASTGPSTTPDFLEALLRATPPTIQDRWFRNQRVPLDGYVFERCRFDHCELITLAATFVFKSCYIAPDCQVVLGGPALKTSRLLLHMLRLRGRITPEIGDASYPTIGPDNTITLT